MRIAAILLPLPLPEAFDYAEPEGMDLSVGDQVAVPLGPRIVRGVVAGLREGAGGNRPLKPVQERLDDPPLPEGAVRFVEWAARYAVDFPGWPLAMALRGLRAPRPRPIRLLVATGRPPARMTPAREKVLAAATRPMTAPELAAEAGVTGGVVKGLVEEGCLEARLELPQTRFEDIDAARPGPTLNASQTAAADVLTGMVREGGFQAALLDGVTGSGKTEVYLEAVAAALQADPEAQVLVLLPEIALTQALIARFEDRFGAAPAEWHSAVAPPRRRQVWEGVASGRARIVVGARSALFLPFKELGLIVIDEEHDQGYKQDDRVHYQARDMGVVRASLGAFPVVLASATPSVESQVNARTERYRHVVLPARYSGAALPEVSAIDLRKHAPEKGKWLSPVLIDAVAETLKDGQQALLFLNRRGYAPLTLCRTCGHRIDCPQCTAWLVEHRFRGRLHCHHCGFSIPLPEKCPKCGEVGALVACGPGVERVAEEVEERFPEARLALLSSDLVPGLAEMRAMIQEIEAGGIDIVIGTQMVAKGHHFPHLATVGVVDGDLGLALGADPRAGERTFQLLHQVTGRAGRALAEGRGYVQTYDPDHPVMAAILANDREAFIAQEIAVRRRGLLPPFGRLVALVVSARDKETAQTVARDIARRAPPAERIEILGPAEAPIAVVRGRHRWRILVKAPRETDVQAYLRAWLASVPQLKGDIRLTVDVDPYSFL